MTAGLGRAEIRSLLEDLDAELARRGAQAPPSEVSRALAAARRLGADAEAARRQMMAGARARRAAILEAHRAGMSVRKIAAELGCSPAVVQDAIRTARTETAGSDSSTGRPPAAGADGRPGTG